MYLNTNNQGSSAPGHFGGASSYQNNDDDPEYQVGSNHYNPFGIPFGVSSQYHMNPSIPPYEGSGFLGQDLIVEDVLGTPPLMNQSLMGGRGDF